MREAPDYSGVFFFIRVHKKIVYFYLSAQKLFYGFKFIADLI